MTVITGVVLDDNQRPAAAVYVSAELVASSRWLADRSGLVEGREDGYSGVDGRWALTLPPRSALLDDGAWWRVRVWGYGTFGVVVPDDPGRPVEAAADGVLRPPGEDDPPPALGEPDTPTGVPLVYVRDPATGEYALVPYDASSSGDLDLAAARAYTDEAVATHRAAALPHPAYDDIPSLRLIYENGLV